MLGLFVAPHVLAAAPRTSSDGSLQSCPPENLLSHARVLGGADVERRTKVLTDGKIVREGSPWPKSSETAVLHEPLVFDLGASVQLYQLFLQVDADQAFALELSSDGNEWSRLPVRASEKASGLSSRNFNLGSAVARFVKLVPTSDPPTLTLTELAVSCQRDAKLKRGLAITDAPRPSLGSSWFPGLLRALTGVPAISPTGANVLKLVLVGVALVLLAVEYRRRRHYLAAWSLLGAIAIAAYFNLGSYRYPEFVHDHDVFHYFVGAKYFPELGYDSLYDCAAVAEAEAGFDSRVRLRAQRDLRNNTIVPGVRILTEHTASCHRRLNAERWQAFCNDVAYFANGRAVGDWHRVLKDHGFNASPTWIALARVVSGHLAANESTIGHKNAVFSGPVGSFDPVLLLLSLFALYWAFGLRTAALVAIVFACNPLSEFAWVGGGFLREAWLATLAIGLSLLKKRHYALGGASLALSALLQLFPFASIATALLAAAVAALAVTWRHARPSARGWSAWLRAACTKLWSRREAWHLAAGVALSCLLLVPLSASGSGDGHAWSEFAANTSKHAKTPSGNLVGLGSLLSFRPSNNVDVLFDANAADPFAPARAARLAVRQSMRPIQALITAAALGALGLSLRRRRELWLAAALGLCLVPFTLDTSCYYAAWLSVFALVSHDDDRSATTVLGTVLALLIAKLTITQLGVDMIVASAILLAGVATVLVLAVRQDGEAATD